MCNNMYLNFEKGGNDREVQEVTQKDGQTAKCES